MLKKSFAGIVAFVMTFGSLSLVPASNNSFVKGNAIVASAEDDSVIEVTDVANFHSEHPVPAGTDKTWTYTADSSYDYTTIKFSDNTSIIDDGGYIRVYDGEGNVKTFKGNELAGKTITVSGNIIKVMVYTYSDNDNSYGFDVESVTKGKAEDLTFGTIEVTDVANFHSVHPVPAGIEKTWTYTADSSYDYTTIKFSDNTSIIDDGGYIRVYDGEGYYKTFYTNQLAGKTITVLGNTVKVMVYTYSDSENSYGFDVESVTKGKAEDVNIGPVTIKNDYLKFVADDNGENFALYANTENGSKKLLYGAYRTSFVSVNVDGTVKHYSSNNLSKTNNIIVSDNTYSGVNVQQKIEFINNVSTGKDDVCKLTYTYTNTDTVNHTVGCRMMLDTMVDGNDSAPFRVPGTGSLTTGKSYTGNDIPQYWQAFDNLNKPTLVAQGSILRDSSNPPDKLCFGHFWNFDADDWEDIYPEGEGQANGDSAVCMFWRDRELAPGQSISFTTYYGLSELIQDVTGNLSLSTHCDKYAVQTDFKDGLPVYDDMTVTSYVKNNTNKDMTNVKVKINLPEGFSLPDIPVNNENASSDNSENQTEKSLEAENTVNTKKQEAEMVIDKLAPSEEKQVSWKVHLDPAVVKQGTSNSISVNAQADGIDGDQVVTENKTNDVSVEVTDNIENKINIEDKDTNINITLPESVVYTGSAIEPEITVKNGEQVLTKGSNYDVEFTNNVNVGEATVKIKGKGMLTGEITKTFKITPKTITEADVQFGTKSVDYDGQAKTPEITVNGLTKDTDYTVAYSDNTNPGTAKVTVTGKGNCTGVVTKTFEIVKKSIPTENNGGSTGNNGGSSGEVSGGNSVISKVGSVKTLKAVSSAKSVKLTWSKASGAKSYTIYKNGKKIKTVKSTSYTVTGLKSGTTYKFTVKPVNGKTSKTITTSTKPAKVTLTVKAGKKKAVIKWKKVTGASGYKVYYKSSAKGKWKSLKTVNSKTTSVTKTGLKKGKKYYFTVKAYRKVAGKVYYGATMTKSAKIK